MSSNLFMIEFLVQVTLDLKLKKIPRIMNPLSFVG